MPPSTGISQSVATEGKAPTPRVEEKTTFLPSLVQPTTLSGAVWKVSWRGLPPVDGNYEDVVVAIAVRRKGDHRAIGREAGELIARSIVGEALTPEPFSLAIQMSPR